MTPLLLLLLWGKSCILCVKQSNPSNQRENEALQLSLCIEW